MKQVILSTLLLILSLNCFAQFGADYSSYGFNFVDNQFNNGLHGWTGSILTDPTKFDFDEYATTATTCNFSLGLQPTNETLSINYNDSGHMDLNPCSFIINVRIKIDQYSGSNDNLTFSLFSGVKKVELEFTENGIFYANNSNTSTLITSTPAPVGQWRTYTITSNSCSSGGETLMIEDGAFGTFPLNLPLDSSPQNINLSASSDGSGFLPELDHFFIHSDPVKEWLGPSTAFVDDTPAGYQGTTGDRQHFLCLTNGERIGVNENGGGLITFTELTPGGPNLDPNPKFGSGSTKTLRAFFHTNVFNPVQAGVSSQTGGHLVDVSTSANKRKLIVDTFPLHSYVVESSFAENTFLDFADGTSFGSTTDQDPLTLTDTDTDGYDEFGLDIRHELMSELDFTTCIEDITRCEGETSTVRHLGDWEYLRHPSHILQFNNNKSAVNQGDRANLPNFTGGPYIGSDTDLGDLRPKFEFRLNRDLGYEYALWRDASGNWQSMHLAAIGDDKQINIDANTPKEQRFLVLSKSPDPNDPDAVSWFYPESAINSNSTEGRSRDDKSVVYAEDRRTRVRLIADWRKTNWMRMNLYVNNEGLIAPPNGDPDVYESVQIEALQYFGTPNEILNEISVCGVVTTVTGDTFCEGTPASFSISGTPNSMVTYNIDGGTTATVNLDATGMATVAASNTASSKLNLVLLNCSEELTGSADINILDAIPTPTVTGGTFCQGTPANFSISGTPNTTVTYNIDGGGTATVNLDATGMATVATSNTASSKLNLVNIAYSSGSPNCSKELTGSADIIIPDLIPTPTVTGGSFCQGTPASFSFSGTPNTIVTYNIDGGTTATINLGATGMTNVAASNTAGSILNLVSIADSGSPNCSKALTGSASIILDGPTCFTPVYNWSFRDPCNCGNPNNITLADGTILFADFIEVDASQFTNPMVSLSSADDKFLDSTGTPINPATATFIPQGEGIFLLPFYARTNAPASFVVDVNGDQQSGNSNPCSCIIPTLSQWGLLIYGLLILNLFTIALYRKKSVLE